MALGEVRRGSKTLSDLGKNVIEPLNSTKDSDRIQQRNITTAPTIHFVIHWRSHPTILPTCYAKEPHHPQHVDASTPVQYKRSRFLTFHLSLVIAFEVQFKVNSTAEPLRRIARQCRDRTDVSTNLRRSGVMSRPQR